MTGSWETRSGGYFALSLFPCVVYLPLSVPYGWRCWSVQGGGSLGGPLWGLADLLTGVFIGDWSGDWLCVIIGRDVFLRFPGSTLLFAAPRSLWCLGFWARGVHCAFGVLGGLAEGVRCAKCPCSMHSGARVFFGHTALVVFWFGLGCGSRFLCAAAGLLSLVSVFFFVVSQCYVLVVVIVDAPFWPRGRIAPVWIFRGWAVQVPVRTGLLPSRSR